MNNNPSISLRIYYLLLSIPLIFPLIGALFDNFIHASTLELLDEILMPEIHLWELGVIMVVTLIASIIIIGLFMRKEWARKTYIYTFIPFYLVYLLPFMRWSYMTGLSSIFNNLAFVSSGMLLLILILPQLYQPIFHKESTSK